MFNKLFVFCLTLIIIQPLFAQDRSPCYCCAYSTFLYPNVGDSNRSKYEFYPQHIMKNVGRKKFNYYTIDKYKNETSQTVQMNFDKNGYLISKITYSNGIPSNKHEYQWDKNLNIILSETINLLAEDGEIFNFLDPIITTYQYNDKALLVTKTLENASFIKGVNYTTTYEYDEQNRLILKDHGSYSYRISYDDDNNTKTKLYITEDSIYSTEIFFYDNQQRVTKQHLQKIGSTDISTTVWEYDENGHIISKIWFRDGEEAPATLTQKWEYNSKGLTTKYYEESPTLVSECPSKGADVVEEYTYNTKGVLKKVSHRFDDKECIIKLKK